MPIHAEGRISKDGVTSRLLQLAFRGYELLKAIDPRVWRENQDVARSGLPPAYLRVQVAGTARAGWFVEGGRLAAQSLADVLRKNRFDPAQFRSVLDFGCGCGRVIRHLECFSNASLHGTDVNGRLIGWCREHLQVAAFSTNGMAPPLAFEDGRFDLIYAFSALTHLSESLQREWMAELARVLRPGGCLVLSLHGEHSSEILEPNERRRFDAGELVVHMENGAGSNLCNSYHPRSYVESVLAPPFTVVDFVAEGARGNPHQDLYLLRLP